MFREIEVAPKSGVWFGPMMTRVCGILFLCLCTSLGRAGEYGLIGDPLIRPETWTIEQQPGGTVAIRDGLLSIDDAGGCTVWFNFKLHAPLAIHYEARVLSSGRVSDLNCFWMASDPKRPDLFAPGHGRDGKFATYDSLLTYYVGYGGNDNTTTRFRRYDGTGARPLQAGHDKRAPEFLLKADHWYQIMLTVKPDGHVEFIRDGETVFDFADPAPLAGGWFGFRTVNSRIEIRNFWVSVPGPGVPPPAATR